MGNESSAPRPPPEGDGSGPRHGPVPSRGGLGLGLANAAGAGAPHPQHRRPDPAGGEDAPSSPDAASADPPPSGTGTAPGPARPQSQRHWAGDDAAASSSGPSSAPASPRPQQAQPSASLMSRAGRAARRAMGMRNPSPAASPDRGNNGQGHGSRHGPTGGFNGYSSHPSSPVRSAGAGEGAGARCGDLSPGSRARQISQMKRRQLEESQRTQPSRPHQSHPRRHPQQSARPDPLNTSVDSAASGSTRYHTPTSDPAALTPEEREAAESAGGAGGLGPAQTRPAGGQNEEEDWAKAWSDDEESDDDDDEGDAGDAKSELPLTKTFRDGAAVGGGAAAGQRQQGARGVGQTSSLPPVPAVAQHAGFVPVRPAPDAADRNGGAAGGAFRVVQPRATQGHGVAQGQGQGITQQQEEGRPGTAPPRRGDIQAGEARHAFRAPVPQQARGPAQVSLQPRVPRPSPPDDDDESLTRLADEELAASGGWDDYDSARPGGGVPGLVDEGSRRDPRRPERIGAESFEPALRVLGRGSFGRVVLVQKRSGPDAGGLYAMKVLRKSHLVRRRQIERTRTERQVLSRLDHPFLMRLYYAFQTPEKLYLVLDYCPGGELFFHLSRYRRFQEPVARFYAAELLLAIGHLHGHGIIYRDLKPENVLLDAYGHVKLGDFGLAKDGICHPTRGAKSTCGTPEYMAPEVLNQTGHGFCVDYWGLGMILYEMMTGLPPWYTTDRSKLFRRLRSAPLVFPKEVHFTPPCRSCIAGLLEREPRLRVGVLGLRSAVRHEFFYRRIDFDALASYRIAAPIRPCEAWRQVQRSAAAAEAPGGRPRPGAGGHDAPPPVHDGGGAAVPPAMTAEALDAATANFDESFQRMPIETEDYERRQAAAGHPPITEGELNEGTFRGFTFDGEAGASS